MSYKREDPTLEQALQDGHLPGHSEDFFTEAQMKTYFQRIVQREIEEVRNHGGANAGMSEANTTQNRGAPLHDVNDQDDQAPDF